MNVSDYLKRIGFSSEIGIDYATLQLLQQSHLMTVPFENIDIHSGKNISLNIRSIFRKVVERNRGGYCYELNGLFHWLLTSIGFNSTILSGRVRSNNNKFGPEFDHMVLLVSLDDEYIVDVGFGDSSRNPVPLGGETASDVSGKYRVEPIKNRILGFQKEVNHVWETQFTFTLEPRCMSDFEDMNKYQQTSPKSHFTKSLICSIANPGGRVSLSGNRLIITEDGGRTEKTVESNKEFTSVLSEYFGMNIAHEVNYSESSES